MRGLASRHCLVCWRGRQVGAGTPRAEQLICKAWSHLAHKLRLPLLQTQASAAALGALVSRSAFQSDSWPCLLVMAHGQPSPSLGWLHCPEKRWVCYEVPASHKKQRPPGCLGISDDRSGASDLHGQNDRKALDVSRPTWLPLKSMGGPRARSFKHPGLMACPPPLGFNASSSTVRTDPSPTACWSSVGHIQ